MAVGGPQPLGIHTSFVSHKEGASPHCRPKHRSRGQGGCGTTYTAQTHTSGFLQEPPFSAGCSSPFLPMEMQQQQEAVAPRQSPSASACLLLAIFGESLQVLPHSEQVTSWLWPIHVSQSHKPGQTESPECWSCSQRYLEMCGCFPVSQPRSSSLAGGCVLPDHWILGLPTEVSVSSSSWFALMLFSYLTE